MLCLSEEDSNFEALMIERGAAPLIPLIWPGLKIFKTSHGDLASTIPSGVSLHGVPLPYTCEALWAPIIGLAVTSGGGQSLTVSDDGVANVKELLMSGWTVEIDSDDEVDRANCTRDGPDGTYQFCVEGNIEFTTFGIGKALVGDMRLTDPDLMFYLHKRCLLSATTPVRIASKVQYSRGREVQSLYIGGSSSQPTPAESTGIIGQCPELPVTINMSSHFALNPQAPSYLWYSPTKPELWKTWSIPSLGIAITAMGEVIISQGLIVILNAGVLISSEWKCLQPTSLVVPGVFKRTISNCAHIIQVHGESQSEEQGTTLIEGADSTLLLRSKSFSNLEIIEGEIKSVLTTTQGWTW